MGTRQKYTSKSVLELKQKIVIDYCGLLYFLMLSLSRLPITNYRLPINN
ncbi:hypothetical protein BGP_1271 [Beggiatoa sp. PS]|nr:hypothetical protein BGP_1271 [Beggiatoa sp. PS]